MICEMNNCKYCGAKDGDYHARECRRHGLSFCREDEDKERVYIAEQLARISELTEYKNCTFKNYDCNDMRYTKEEREQQADTFSEVIAYAERLNERYANISLVLYGETGTGKTHLSFGLFRYFIEHGYTVIREPIWSILHNIRDTYRSNSPTSAMKVIERYRAPHFLIIDELGANRQFNSDAEQTELHKLVDERHSRGKPTIITTNQDKDGMMDAIGEAAFSRLSRSIDGEGIFLPFTWRDRRKL
jgi:DNA replication protein DnaC